MKSFLKNYRQQPRKVRLVADLIRGKNVKRALSELQFLSKKASSVFMKLINSAASNAKHNHDISAENLFIKTVTVDKGITMKRIRMRARGSASPIHKTTSRIGVVLEEGTSKKTKKEAVRKTVKKIAKKSKSKIASDVVSPKKDSTSEVSKKVKK